VADTPKMATPQTQKATSVRGPDPQPIFDAAVVIIADLSSGEPRIFLGRRQMGNVFLPGKWVFPGGRVEPDDLSVTAGDTLDDGDIAALVWGMAPPWTLRQASAMALTAVREVFEETGLAIGRPGQMTDTVPPAWATYASTGLKPTIAPLKVVARAITPPGRPRRYDTRFFVAPASAIGAATGVHDGEFTEQDWFTVPECRALDLPNITRLVLDDACDMLAKPLTGGTDPVPYYYQDGAGFRRDLIPR
jgi:8-oxo-dGTP pyrophosphatase MutT (NUDIX family)